MGELYWKFVTDGWDEPSNNVTCTIHLPIPVGQTPVAGYVSALPGDTITLDGKQYMIPERCACNGTECGYCRNYLVEWGDNESLVSEQRMLGKAYKLW